MGMFDFLKKQQGKYSLNWIISQNTWMFPENNGNDYIDKGYKELPNIYSIISLITQKSSIVPFEIYKIKNKGKYQKYKSLMQLAKTTKDFANIVRYKAEAFDKVENSDLENLLLTPNGQQSTQELFESLDGYKLLTGNAYLFGLTPGIGLNANKPKELYSIPSPMVSIISISVFEGIKAYKFSFINEEILADEVAHFKYWNPITGDASLNDIFYGQSPLQACRMLMGKYKDADITQGSMFKNQGPAGILAGENGSDLTETQALAIKDKFKQIYQGANKAGEIIVTPAKLSWQQIGLSPVDLNIIEGKADMLSELCNAYHVPIGLFSAKNSTENNMIESRKMLITDAVIPLVEGRKAVLNRWLASKFGNEFLIEFDYTVFNEIQEDLSKLAETANKMYWTTPNEKRALTNYDQDPDPLMDKKYFPSGLTLLEDLNGNLDTIDETLLNQ